MQRVVVLGGGYAGIEACKKMAQLLGRELATGQVELTLVSRDPYHTFHGWTTEVLGGLIPLKHTLTPLKEILPHPGIRLLLGTVQALDLPGKQVQVQTAGGLQHLAYDHVFLGLGSRDPFERIEGLEQHGWCLKDTLHMQGFRAELHRRLTRSLQGDTPLERLVVVGGGFAGVECAAALAELIKETFASHPQAIKPRLTLLHSGKGLLENLRPRFSRLADAATVALQKYGIEVKYNTRIKQIMPQGAVLQDGTTELADMVLVTAGISILTLPGSESLSRDDQHRLITNPFLQVSGQQNVWTGGDIARVKHPLHNENCPVNALWAMKQGLHAGVNIARTIQGKPPLPFRYPGMGQAASLGWGDGITELYGLQFSGFVGWLMRLGFFLWYMPSKKGGLRVLKDVLALRRRGRQLEPEPEMSVSAPPVASPSGV